MTEWWEEKQHCLVLVLSKVKTLSFHLEKATQKATWFSPFKYCGLLVYSA